MRVSRVFTPCLLMALGLGLAMSFAACSTANLDDARSGISREERKRAESLHGNDASVSRALSLFDRLAGQGESQAQSYADEMGKKVFVSHLHRVSLQVANYGRQDFRSARDDENADDTYSVDSTRYVGWVAQLATGRSGLVETIFYDRSWNRLARLSRDGFLTIGSGKSVRTVSHKVDVAKGAEIVYRAPSRVGIRTWDEDITELGRITDNPSLTEEYKIHDLTLGSRTIHDVERIRLESRPADEFSEFFSERKKN